MALVVATQDKARARRLQRLSATGRLRQICPGIYTDDLVQPLESIVRHELFALCSLVAPGTSSRIVQTWREVVLPLREISSSPEPIAETLNCPA